MSLTVVIAHYRRGDNVDAIAANLPNSVRLFIVDNATDGSRLGRIASERSDWILTSSRNNLSTRWYMASQADTMHYCVHDDDLLLPKDHYLRYVDYMVSSEDESRRILTGPYGVRLIKGKSYLGSHHTSSHDDCVDIIKGRMMFGTTESINEFPVCPPGIDGIGYETVISEDIYVSSCISKNINVSLKVTNFGGIINLPSPFASSASSIHFERRNVACHRLFGHL